MAEVGRVVALLPDMSHGRIELRIADRTHHLNVVHLGDNVLFIDGGLERYGHDGELLAASVGFPAGHPCRDVYFVPTDVHW